jgi:uncharacterized Zn-finger protein
MLPKGVKIKEEEPLNIIDVNYIEEAFVKIKTEVIDEDSEVDIELNEEYPNFDVNVKQEEIHDASDNDHEERVEENRIKITFDCDLCDKKYNSKYAMIIHFKAHHLNKRYKCELCDKVFVLKDSMQKHKREKHESVECKICYENFNSYHSLKKHLLVKHAKEEKSHECDICHHLFTLRKEMQRHKSSFHAAKNVKCEYNGCYKMFRYPSEMRKHYKRVHLRNI